MIDATIIEGLTQTVAKLVQERDSARASFDRVCENRDFTMRAHNRESSIHTSLIQRLTQELEHMGEQRDTAQGDLAAMRNRDTHTQRCLEATKVHNEKLLKLADARQDEIVDLHSDLAAERRAHSRLKGQVADATKSLSEAIGETLIDITDGFNG